MNYLRTFDIRFVGLSVGKHIFTYEIGKEFFANFKKSPVEIGDLYVHLTFEKKERLFQLDFYIDGSLRVECDRCLDEFDLQVTTTPQLICKFEGENSSADREDPNVLIIAPEDDTINVAQQLYEFIILQIPMKKTCAMDRMGEKVCNPKMMKHLREKMIDEDNSIDPRWNKLKDILNN